MTPTTGHPTNIPTTSKPSVASVYSNTIAPSIAEQVSAKDDGSMVDNIQLLIIVGGMALCLCLGIIMAIALARAKSKRKQKEYDESKTQKEMSVIQGSSSTNLDGVNTTKSIEDRINSYVKNEGVLKPPMMVAVSSHSMTESPKSPNFSSANSSPGMDNGDNDA